MLSAGYDDFVRKPFRESEIFEMMEKHIGVRFVYDSDETVLPPSQKNTAEISSERWAAVPKELSESLEDATIRADMSQIFEIIGKIEKIDNDIAGLLRRMADEFDYAEILSLIRSFV